MTQVSIHFTAKRILRLITAMAAIVLVLHASQARATAINVPNASFELPSPPTNGDGAPISGWVFNVQGGNLYGTSKISNSFVSEGAASGNDYAWLQNNVGAVDTITSAASLGLIQANTTYTLTVAIGNVAGSDSTNDHFPGNVSFSLLANGVAFATTTVPNGSVPDGTFKDFNLTFQTPTSGNLIGDYLTIQLASLPTAGGLKPAPAFDNVTLDATPTPDVPEPPTLVLLAAGAIGLAWLMRQPKPNQAAWPAKPGIKARSQTR